VSQRTMRILIEVSAAVLAAAALVHAYFVAPLLFWPLVSLMASSAVLAAHSPMALSRRMTFLAHAQAHSILTASLLAAIPAAALGAGLSSPLFLAFTLVAMVLLNFAVLAVERLGYARDVATGVVMSLQVSATVALLYLVRLVYAAVVDPLAVLTGEYVLITPRDVAQQAPLLAAAAVFPLAFGVKYLYAAVDEQYARAVGIRVGLYDFGYVFSMSIAAAAGIYALGALMPAVLLVMPGAVAARQSKRLLDQIPLSTSFGVLSAAVAHFLYTALPWLWPSAALGLVLALLLAVGFRGRG